MNKTEELCSICHKEEADYEGVICHSCKQAIDEGNSRAEIKAYEDDMLSYNHKGETCWLDGRTCQEGWCSGCQIYQSWKDER